MKTVIEWINPKEKIPPFNTRILVLLGGQGSLDCMRTWERYATIRDVVMTRSSPNDCGEDGNQNYHEFMAEEDQQSSFGDYQFDVRLWYEHKFCGEEDADWYSDSILMWAPIPDFGEAIDRHKK